MQIAKCYSTQLNFRKNNSAQPRQIGFGTAIPQAKGSIMAQISLSNAMQALSAAKALNAKEVNGHLSLIGQLLDAMTAKMPGDPTSQIIYEISKRAKAGIADDTTHYIPLDSPNAKTIQSSLQKAISCIYSEQSIMPKDGNIIFTQTSILLNDIADKIQNQQEQRKLRAMSDELKNFVDNRSTL